MWQAIVTGLSQVVPMQLLRSMNCEEFMLAVCGERCIDAHDLQAYLVPGDG